MGIHYYDSSPFCSDTQHTLLQAARCITHAGIPCLLWAEEALSFGHYVPMMLAAQQLIVPDHYLSKATEVLTNPQKNPTLEDYVGPFEVVDPDLCWYDYGLRRWSGVPVTERAHAFPKSIHLKGVPIFNPDKMPPPAQIYLHPSSFFRWNFEDPSRFSTISLSPPLSPENADIQVPSRGAFLDTLADLLFDPPDGTLEDNTDHIKLRGIFRVWFGFLVQYTTHGGYRDSESGNLTSKGRKMFEEIRPENRGFFESMIRVGNTPMMILKEQRQEFLAGQRKVTTEILHLGNTIPPLYRSSSRHLPSSSSTQKKQFHSSPSFYQPRTLPSHLNRPIATPNQVNSQALANAARMALKFSRRG